MNARPFWRLALFLALAASRSVAPLDIIVSNHEDKNAQIRLQVTTANGPDQFWDEANMRKQRDILMEERCLASPAS
jgi:hypothetical protein